MRKRSSSTGRNSDVAVYTSSWVVSSGRISYCHTAHPRSSPRRRNTNESRVAGTWATSNWSELGRGMGGGPDVWPVAADASGGLASSRKQSQRIGLENRLLVRVAERQRQELVDVVQRPAQERSEEHTSELQSLAYLVCRLLLEKKKKSAAMILLRRPAGAQSSRE